MKGNSGSGKLPALMLILGIAAFVLRKLLYAAAVDPKGLLVRNHPLSIVLAVLSAVVLAMVVLAVRRLDVSGSCEVPASAGLSGAFGNLAAGAGILVTVLAGAPMMGGYLDRAWQYLGLAAPVCLLLAGITRALGKKPFFLLHVAPCLFFLIHIVTHYQLWSGNPQMQDYVFSLLGAMALTLFAFYTAAVEAGCGKASRKLGAGLAAIYLCLGELARSACPGLYLGGTLWALTELGTIRKAEQK